MDTLHTSKTRNPAFGLSASQEELLSLALNSNKKTSGATNSNTNKINSFPMAPALLSDSPSQAQSSGSQGGFDDSPFIDYDYDFDPEGSFDYDFINDSQGQMVEKLPGTSSDGDAENNDKRSHPDDDGDDEEGGGKRREGDEKTGKKPGRKPLTSEPTSKRKAQNRAAQRAFRERKEKHLKDLETKVEDLEKSSESANHENSILRAQIEKMSAELRDYKKRLSLTGGMARTSSLNPGVSSYLPGKSITNGAVNNPNDVNFQFDFPRFGRLPGPPVTKSSLSNDNNQISPRNQSMQYSPTNISNVNLTETPTALEGGDMSSLSGLFSPSPIDSLEKSPGFEYFPNTTKNSIGSTSSADSAAGNSSTGLNASSYSSPSSTGSNQGPSSSCGTSPEPTSHSPNYAKASDSTLTTIGEENSGLSGEGELTFCDKLNMACGNPNNPIPRTLSEPGVTPGNLNAFAAFDSNSIDWFAQQNNNQFDPQLFNDYREPQENILYGDAFVENFFSDAYAIPDFISPFNTAPTPAAAKKDLLQQIEDKQNEEDEVVPGEDRSQMLSCNTIWDRLQACPKIKDGEFDLDLLCKDLQKKAKCSETGAVVNESDFNKIMKTYVDRKTRDQAAKTA